MEAITTIKHLSNYNISFLSLKSYKEGLYVAIDGNQVRVASSTMREEAIDCFPTCKFHYTRHLKVNGGQNLGLFLMQ